jgi:hypothetical protein
MNWVWTDLHPLAAILYASCALFLVLSLLMALVGQAARICGKPWKAGNESARALK